jgi:hypothetical protein
MNRLCSSLLIPDSTDSDPPRAFNKNRPNQDFEKFLPGPGASSLATIICLEARSFGRPVPPPCHKPSCWSRRRLETFLE